MRIINDMLWHICYQIINGIGVIAGLYMILAMDSFVEAILFGGLLFMISFIAFFHRQKFY